MRIGTILIAIIIGLVVWIGTFMVPWLRKQRSLLRIIRIVCFLPLVFLVVSMLPLFIISIGAPAPPAPEITYGEFPFRLEYEIEGERFVIEDTLIAEFDKSIRGNATTRARRIWNRSKSCKRWLN